MHKIPDSKNISSQRLSYKVEEVDFLMFSSCEAVGGNVEDEIAAW